MTDLQEKAMRMAYEVMTDIDQVCEGANHKRKDMHPYGGECPIQKRFDDAWEALRQALAQPELQHRTGDCLLTGICAAERHKIYTAPPKREWVSVTHIEIGNLWAKHKEVYGFAMALDNLLKEKNT